MPVDICTLWPSVKVTEDRGQVVTDNQHLLSDYRVPPEVLGIMQPSLVKMTDLSLQV